MPSATCAPLRFLAALARLIPPPRIHHHRYHGVLAPNARLRARVVALGRTEGEGDEPPDGGDRSYDVMPDGAHFLMFEANPAAAPELRVVRNWAAEVRSSMGRR